MLLTALDGLANVIRTSPSVPCVRRKTGCRMIVVIKEHIIDRVAGEPVSGFYAMGCCIAQCVSAALQRISVTKQRRLIKADEVLRRYLGKAPFWTSCIHYFI